ncbi:hypothetical protein [Arthrobacter sp. 8AJ]|uniref:hypothetical protein n=1 Tax=Arthrobacter sp. 8AJ TaxID=2653130 RepID=UPI0012F0B1E8|nr:hypothetical protein [Arthrobacter sp. 8AJ]VXC34118.1 conserved hypothetical protein [Arthrobacter sp. 8AJ]
MNAIAKILDEAQRCFVGVSGEDAYIMTEEQIQDIANRVIAALEQLAPSDPGFRLADASPIAVLIAAVVALLIGLATVKQKREADARSEWWKRTQWALEASASKDPKMYAYGTGMLDLLAQSELAGPKDKELLDAVWETGDTGMKDEDIAQLIKEASEQDDLSAEDLLSLISFASEDFDVLEQLREQADKLPPEDSAKAALIYGVIAGHEAMAAMDAKDARAAARAADAPGASGSTEPPKPVDHADIPSGKFARFRTFFKRVGNSAKPASVDDSLTPGDNVEDTKEVHDGNR